MTWWAHRRLRRVVSAYVDGELDDATTAVLVAHVRECWACSGDAELQRMMKRSLRNLRGRRRDTLAAVRLRRFAAHLTNGP